jgi:rhomboid protease GluP
VSAQARERTVYHGFLKSYIDLVPSYIEKDSTNLESVEKASLAEPSTRKSSPFATVVAGLIAVNVVAFVVLSFAFASRFPYRRESLGALWGPLVFGGQWWRLLTYMFVHFELFHLSGNMLGLWILGTRAERRLGKVHFLFVYLASGVAAALAILTFHPLTVSEGASGAVSGLAGSLIVIAIPSLKMPGWQLRLKFALLLVFSLGLVSTEIIRGGLLFAHTTGLLTGAIITTLLAFVAKTKRNVGLTLAFTLLFIFVAAAGVQKFHRRAEPLGTFVVSGKA